MVREVTIETYLMDQVKALGGVAYKLPSQWYHSIPDRMVLLPGGWIAFIELKRPGEKARADQVRFGQGLKRLGFRWYELDTKEKIDELLSSYIAD